VTSRSFGLLGHGVVGSLLVRLLRERQAMVTAYDVLLEGESTASEMQQKIRASGARPATLEETVRETEFVISVTSTQSCRDAAVRACRYLRAGQTYCDFPSTSPGVKSEISALIEATGALFVEGAILGAVGSSDTCPEILLGGTAAAQAAEVLREYGLRTRFYSAEIGRASAFKMIRSVFSKGMETLLIEALVAARRAGLLDEVWTEIKATLAPGRVERTLETWIRSHAISSERRYCEMLEVQRFLEELDLEPLLIPAAAEIFRRSNRLGIATAFNREPESFVEVIEFLELQNRKKREDRAE
jgi:3-hydroxyisobutyrate dehydrogenase-like beta-hydroxyacid dehydrogenase